MGAWKRKCADCICGVVSRNPAALRLIGLCPLLAVSDTTLKAVALGMIFAAVVLISGTIVATLRYCVSWRLKPMYFALVASFTTVGVVACVEIEFYELVAAMGIYPALIAGNCLGLSFMQEVAEQNSPTITVRRGLMDVSAVVAFLGLFGALRELCAHGTIFGDWVLVAGLRPLGATTPGGPFPLMASAPGALLALALLLAAANAISRRYIEPAQRVPNVSPAPPQELGA